MTTGEWHDLLVQFSTDCTANHKFDIRTLRDEFDADGNERVKVRYTLDVENNEIIHTNTYKIRKSFERVNVD